MERRLAGAKYEEEAKLALRAAREAGDYLISLAEGQRSVHRKLPRDVKLSGDMASESIIVNVLSEGSHHPIVAEESGIHGEVRPGQPYWVVDPIDGTFNFYRGIPLVAISIALWCDGEPILGLVYDFHRGDVYFGVVGIGAWLNNNEISVSAVRESKEAVLATGLPVQSMSNDDGYVARLAQMFHDFAKTRMLGSAALSMAYLACGRVDAYAEDEIMLWDVAAGIALTRAAGGYVGYESTDSDYGLRVRGASSEAIWAC